MRNRSRSFTSDDSGAVLVLGAILMVVFLGCAALAIDIGHLMVVKNELQNAADAGSHDGARALVPYINLAAPVPYWSNGQTVAEQSVKRNKSDGVLLTDCQVEVGYWNLTNGVLQPTNINPTNLDAPAVRVTVSRVAGQNSGAVLPFLGQVLGINFMNVSAHATSVISGSSAVNAHGLFPLAVAQQLVIDHWDDCPAYKFRIGSDYHYEETEAGQWTTFLVDENNVPYVRKLMENGSPDKICIGDKIWIEPGTKDTLWAQCQDFVGKTVTLPVVKTDFSTHAYTPVLGFVPFYIEEAQGGSGKFIRGHFVRDHIDRDGAPGGPSYGNFSPPRVVQ
jgi:Flp pilus assembly protein TadG